MEHIHERRRKRESEKALRRDSKARTRKACDGRCLTRPGLSNDDDALRSEVRGREYGRLGQTIELLVHLLEDARGFGVPRRQVVFFTPALGHLRGVAECERFGLCVQVRSR